jgi:hypothetical protein
MSFFFLLSKSETENLSHGSVSQFKELTHQVLYLWPNLYNSPSWIQCVKEIIKLINLIKNQIMMIWFDYKLNQIMILITWLKV